jgi:hypothetical protein
VEELGINEDLEPEREDEGIIENIPSIDEGNDRVLEDITSAAKKLSLPVQKARKVLMVSASKMSET